MIFCARSPTAMKSPIEKPNGTGIIGTRTLGVLGVDVYILAAATRCIGYRAVRCYSDKQTSSGVGDYKVDINQEGYGEAVTVR